MKILKNINKIALLFSLVFTVLSCDDNDNPAIEKLPTAFDIVQSDSNYSVFIKALEVSGLKTATSNVLANAGSYTIFLPTNAAFASYSSALIPQGTLVDANVNTTTLSASQQGELKRLVLNHLIGTAVLGSDLPNKGYLKSMSPFGTSTSITLSMYFDKTSGVVINGGASNGGATVTQADINVSNGVVHKVDQVIKLPTLVSAVSADKDLTSLLGVVSDPAQSAVLSQLTSPASNTQLFAPNNTAFATALATGGYLDGKGATDISKILRYHIATAGSFTQTAVIGTSTGNINNGSSSTSSFLPSSATTDATVTTRASVGVTSNFQTFRVEKGTLKIYEMPTISVAASNMKVVNIHTSNGIVHTIDRVLQPVLP